MTDDDRFDYVAEFLAWIWVVVLLVGLVILAGHLMGCSLMTIEAQKITCSFEPLPKAPELYISHPESEQTCMSDADWQSVKWYVQQMRGQYAAAAVRCAEGK